MIQTQAKLRFDPQILGRQVLSAVIAVAAVALVIAPRMDQGYAWLGWALVAVHLVVIGSQILRKWMFGTAVALVGIHAFAAAYPPHDGLLTAVQYFILPGLCVVLAVLSVES